VKRLIPACIVCLILSASAMLAFAEIRSFIKEYTYEASELDSKTSCRAIALEQVKRELLEELGTYVESTTVVQDYAIEKDEIRTISAGVVQTRLIDEKWNGRDYWLKAQLSADPDEVAASIAKVRNDSKLAEELAESRAEKEDALREVDRLKAELADARADQAQSREALNQYNSAVTQLQASDSFEQGTAMAVSGDYEGAAKAYDRSITLQPDNAKAYFNRSIVYIYLGDYNRATRDLDRAMAIRPANTNTYFQRAAAYKDVRERKIAIPGPKMPPAMRRPPSRPLPADDPLQRYLDRKQAEHHLVRVNPFLPKPRLRREDRPVRPSVERPVLDRGRRTDINEPASIDRSRNGNPPDRPYVRQKTGTPDQPRIVEPQKKEISQPVQMDRNKSVNPQERPFVRQKIAVPDQPHPAEPQKPEVRRPARVVAQPPAADAGKPITKPHAEPVKKKTPKEIEEEKRLKKAHDEKEQEKPAHR